jgi:hypothetical protein
MTAFTTQNMRDAGVVPASTDLYSFPGTVVLEYVIDGAKKAIAAADTVDFFDLANLTGANVVAAAVTVVSPGTASGTLAIQIGGTSVTGLTAWATDAVAGTKLVKLATAANTVVNAGSASAVRLLQSTAGLGTGKLRIRIWLTLLEAPAV